MMIPDTGILGEQRRAFAELLDHDPPMGLTRDASVSIQESLRRNGDVDAANAIEEAIDLALERGSILPLATAVALRSSR